MPIQNEEVQANSFLMDNVSVTISFEGDELLEQERKFYVHLNHQAHELCNDNCEKIEMNEYIQTRNLQFDSKKLITTYLHSVSTRLHSFVENIVKCPASDLYSEEFFFTVAFDGVGTAYIRGLTWPKLILLYNEDKSQRSFFGGQDGGIREQYLEFVNSSFSSMTSKEDIKEHFDLNNKEADKLVKLVKANQVCHTDVNPPLPSLITCVKHLPDQPAMHNIFEARELCKIMVHFLVEIDRVEREELSTKDWLCEIGTWKVDFDDSDTIDEDVTFSLDGREFSFILDAKLLELLVKFDNTFLAVYHYCISCGDDESVVMKRPQILDAFTHVYNPFVLKAMKSTLEITPVHSFAEWKKESLSRHSLFFNEDGIDANLSASHSQVSLHEAYSLVDARHLRDISSPPCVFVNTNMDAQSTFLRVNEKTETSYQAEGSNDHFEQQFNIVSRHNSRLNGHPLLLVETACLYEYVGSSESQELFEVYRNQLDKIPVSETSYTASPEEMMPSLLLTENGSVLKKRSNCKVLCYPSYERMSKKWKYSRVILFYPLQPNAEVPEDQIEDLFYKRSEMGPLDSNRCRLTIIDNNER